MKRWLAAALTGLIVIALVVSVARKARLPRLHRHGYARSWSPPAPRMWTTDALLHA
ncbi:MAG TPA: hypothetical protein VGN38_09585 [Caulobacteraceae bacterium]|nr:hypothetical protein [Caulobacteraceae bacterium]